MNAPHWSLKTIKGLAADGAIVLTRTKAIASFPNVADAYDAARQVIAGLTSMHFAHSLHQADV